jgi:lysyl-tRNA synthetase class 2
MEPTLYAVAAADGYLRTSPEFALKRAMASGLPRIYEIGPCFRERERGRWHGREFTMLEWYRAGASLDDLMEEVISLCTSVARHLDVPVPGPWRKVSVRELFIEHVGVDIAHASAVEISPSDADDWDGAFFRRWVHDVEPQLHEPCFVTEWPASQAALAQIRRHRAWPVAARFEVFIGGVEIGNAFLELTNAEEQRARCETSRHHQQVEGSSVFPVDEAFVEAVGRLPPCAGIAMGLDRLVAVLHGSDSIHPFRVASFPGSAR